MLFNAFLKGLYWAGPWCNWVFCNGQSPGMGPACRLDAQGRMRQFPGAEAQTGLRGHLSSCRALPGAKLGMPRDTHHTHSHMLTYIQTPYKWHATVPLTCNDALYSGIAALIITRPVDPPSQTKKGRPEAFPGRQRDKRRHIESPAALGHHKGATFHQ